MSEDPSYGSFSQFGDSQDTQAIPPISSFAKRNALITSAGSEECSAPSGFYRELTLEVIDPDVSGSTSSQSSSPPAAMQPQSQSHQSQQQYATAVAAAVAAAYQAHAHEMSNLTATTLVPGTRGSQVLTSVTSGTHPSIPISVNNMASPPPNLSMHMQSPNSTLLGQALQAANDMGGMPVLQLAAHHHQQQQQLLHAVHAAQAQHAGQKMMSPTQSENSTPNEGESRESKSPLVNLMPAVSLATPVSIHRSHHGNNVLTMTASSQLQTPHSSQLTTSTPSMSNMSDNIYSMPVATYTSTVPSGNLSTEMNNNASAQVSNIPMGIPSHYMQLNNTSVPIPQMLTQAGTTSQGIMSPDQQMMGQGMPNNISNNTPIDMQNSMPVTNSQSSTSKRRNNKKPVPTEDKDDKYFERRNRNNLAAKRSRDTRKRREDQVSMRANFLEKENEILRAQLATLREEANSLRHLLAQQRPIMPSQMPMQMMHKNILE